jgi:hypothetical protein
MLTKTTVQAISSQYYFAIFILFDIDTESNKFYINTLNINHLRYL